MSFLSNRYLREGPGVYPEDLDQGPFTRFFGILGRKFWKICTLNLMYVLFSLPVLALSILLAPSLLRFLAPTLTVESLTAFFARPEFAESLVDGVTPESFAHTTLLMLYTLFIFFQTAMAWFVIGPVHAGMTYVLRNFSREEHAFVWSDFWEHARKNLKQATASGLLSMVISIALVVSYGFYRAQIGPDFFRLLMVGFLFVIFAVFTVMQMYIYPMMVTFELPLKNLYKNAFLFFTLRLFPNLGLLLLSLVLNLVIPLALVFFLQLLGFYLVILYFVVLGFGLQFLMTNFYVYQQLDRFMIQRLAEDEQAEAPESPATDTSPGETGTNPDQ